MLSPELEDMYNFYESLNERKKKKYGEPLRALFHVVKLHKNMTRLREELGLIIESLGPKCSDADAKRAEFLETENEMRLSIISALPKSGKAEKAIREIGNNLIRFEKNAGLFLPENWPGFFDDILGIPYKSEKELTEYFHSMSGDELEDEVLRLSAIAKNIPLYLEDPEFAEDVKSMEKSLEDYNNIVAEEKVQELKHEIEIDIHLAEAEKATNNIKKIVIREILAGGEKVEEFRRIADELMQIEKDHNLFDPEFWKEIL